MVDFDLKDYLDYTNKQTNKQPKTKQNKTELINCLHPSPIPTKNTCLTLTDQWQREKVPPKH